MDLRLKVLVSSSIRRKKPWSHVEWIGRQKESVCLLDRRRSSILYLPSGRTKRVIGALKPYLKNILYQTTSLSGEYLIALTISGGILRWHKDTDQVIIIPACPGFTLFSVQDARGVKLFISNDGKRALAVFNHQKLYVWEEVVGGGGEWSSVSLGLNMLASLASHEASVDALFFSNQVQGDRCLCTFVFADNLNLNIYSLLLQWRHGVYEEASNFSSMASLMQHPLNNFNPPCKAIRKRGFLVSRLSHNGCVLAVALNQPSPHQSQLILINVFSQVVMASSYGKDSIRHTTVLSKFSRSYWIAKMAWLHDDLLLACITRRGSLLIFTRTGEPASITTYGLGMELGPAAFLPIHPLVENLKKKEGDVSPHRESATSLESSLASDRKRTQKFSVSSHPRLPIIICSDGFVVTALQLTTANLPHDVAILLLLEANERMKRLVEDYHLKIEAASTPRRNQPLPVLDEAKFKESKYARLYAYVKRKLKRKKANRGKENHLEQDDSLPIGQNTVDLLAYQFEKAEDEDSGEDPDSLEENQKEPVGAIIGADEGRVGFGDLASSLHLQATLKQELEPSVIQGESLVTHIEWCAEKVVRAFSVILSANEDGFMKQSEDKIAQIYFYFLDTLQMICDVIVATQDTSLCLPWKADDTTFRDYRNLFHRILTSLSSNIVALSALASTDTPLITESVDVALMSTLKLSCRAPEGCMAVSDIHCNVAAALKLLLKVRQVLSTLNSFKPMEVENTLDAYSVLSVGEKTIGFFLDSQSSFVARKLHCYVARVFGDKRHRKDRFSLLKVLGCLQRLTRHDAASVNNEDSRRPTTLANMANNLAECRLGSAFKLATLVLHDHLTIGSKWNKNDWLAVELFCSVMVSYFVDRKISFVSPTSNRMVTIDRRQMIETLKRETWSSQHCLAMLLQCGKLHDARRFASDVGAWRAAVAVGAVASKVRAFAGDEGGAVFDLLKKRFEEILPAILQSQSMDSVASLVCDPESDVDLFVDLFTVGVMVGHDLLKWACRSLVRRLKELCQELTLLVDEEFHLPSPPFYLPQPTQPQDEGRSSNSLLHNKISACVRTLLVIYQSAGLSQSLLLWYVERLRQSQSDVSSVFSESMSKSHDGDNTDALSKQAPFVFNSFREMCGILWMLHAREQLSMAVRRYQAERESFSRLNDAIGDCLLWCGHMKPFAKYFNLEANLQNIVLCLCCEVEPDLALTSMLASYFWDKESVSPKIRPRLSMMEQRLGRVLISQKALKAGGKESEERLVPLSVYYQRQCVAAMKKQKVSPSLFDVFVVSDKTATDPSSFNAPFSYESEHTFHVFISRLFNVFYGRTEANERRRNKSMLIMSKRHEVAMEELASAPDYPQQQRLSVKLKGRDVPQSKAKQTTLRDVTSLYVNDTLNGDVTKPVDQVFESGTKADQGSEAIKCNFDVGDVPVQMRKRYRRLLSFFTWLQYWTESSVPSKASVKRSLHLTVSRRQLLQSLFVADVRFGKTTAFREEKSSVTSTVDDLESVPPPHREHNAAAVPQASSRIDDVDDDLTVVSDGSITPDQSENIAPPNGLSETVEENKVSNTTSNAEAPQAEAENIQADAPEEEVNVEEDKQKKEEDSVDTSSLKLDALQQEVPDENCSDYADGGSSRRPKPLPRRSDAGRSNLAEMVHSEIHNVLLAQQVSLLSQILLAQTMPGQPASGSVADVLNLLGGRPTSTDRNNGSIPLSTCQPSVQEQLQPVVNASPMMSQPIIQRQAQPAVNQFGIPLFHIDGITKLKEDKKVNLMQTPNSKRGWLASQASKQPSNDASFNYFKTKLSPTKHLQSPARNAVSLSANPSVAQTLPKVVKSPVKVSHPEAAKPPVKTSFPILAHDFPPPTRPQFQERPKQQPTPNIRVTQTAAAGWDLPSHRPTNLSLINPREVIAFHQHRQKFISILAKQRPKGTTRPAKPPFVLTLHREPVAKQPPVTKQQPVSKPVVVTPAAAPHSPPPPAEVKSKKPPADVPPVEPFDGYLRQEDVTNEVKKMVSDEDEDKLTQANIHLLTALAKQKQTAPRVVEASSQADVKESEDSEEEEEDFRKKLLSKPLQPPPDIFDRIRDENSGPVNENAQFLHVGDVAVSSVSRGFPMTVAEAHYRSAVRSVAEHPLISDQIEHAMQVRDVGSDTRHRWTSAMEQMSAQLDSIDNMARNMDQGFQEAAKLVEEINQFEKSPFPEHDSKKTVVKTTSTPHQTTTHDRPQPTPFVSTPPQPSYLEQTSPKPAPREPMHTSLATTGSYSYLPPTDPGLFEPIATRPRSDDVAGDGETKLYRKRLNEAYQLASMPEASSEETFSSPPCSTHHMDDLPTSDDVTESVRTSMEDYKTPEEEISEFMDAMDQPPKYGKQWNKRSASEKEAVRRWMQTRRQERTARYRSERAVKKEAEARPFRGTRALTGSQLRNTQERRQEGKRDMLVSHMDARINDSIKLMDEMRSTPNRARKSTRGPKSRSPLQERNGRDFHPYNKAKPNKVTRKSPESSTDQFGNVSISSVMSGWTLSDDVKRALYGTVTSQRRGKVTFNFDSSKSSSTVTGSVISDMDWNAVEAMIASVQESSDA